jgi:ABC-type lipoprotein release transport system permease subunit
MTRFKFLSAVAFLFVWRSWRSTSVLATMVLTAVAALVFLASLAVGTNDAMVTNSVRLFSGHIVAEHIPRELTGALLVGGVEAVLLRQKNSVLLSRGVEPVVVNVVGVDPAGERTYTAIWKKTVSGRYLESGERTLYLGQAAAERLKLSARDRVGIAPPGRSTFTEWVVCGIFHTGISHLDSLVFCPADALPGSDPNPGVAIFLRDGIDCNEVLDTYRSLPGLPELRAWIDFMPDLKQLIDLNFVSMGIVMVLVFGIVSIGIACAFVIFILKNLREHGIMKALGVLPAEAAWLIVSQVAVLTLAAAAGGTVVGALAVAVFRHIGIDLTAFTSHNQYFVVSGIIYPRLTSYSMLWPPVSAVAFGLLASVWPAAFVIRKKAADILRTI